MGVIRKERDSEREREREGDSERDTQRERERERDLDNVVNYSCLLFGFTSADP